MYPPHCLHPSVRGHLGCFHLLAIVKKASLNTGTQIPFQVPAFNFGGLSHVFKANPRGGLFLTPGGTTLGFLGKELEEELQTEDSDCN